MLFHKRRKLTLLDQLANLPMRAPMHVRVPMMLVPERMVVVSCDGSEPFNSAVTRMKLREGKPTPVPQ